MMQKCFDASRGGFSKKGDCILYWKYAKRFMFGMHENKNHWMWLIVTFVMARPDFSATTTTTTQNKISCYPLKCQCK